MEPVEDSDSDSSMAESVSSSMVEHRDGSDAVSVSQEAESELDPLWVFASRGMERIAEHCTEYRLIQQSLLWPLGSLAEQTRIVAVHKNLASSQMEMARFQCFIRFREAVAKKNGGNANCALAWYGASKKEICQILAHGFTGFGRGARNGSAISLSPLRFSLDEVLSAEVDEDGLSHVLLCRTILGKTEVVGDASEQLLPSSRAIECGVNNLERPSKYIVWNTMMNTHIYPSHVISFKAPYLHGWPLGNITWTSFTALNSVLSSLLHPPKMAEISKCFKEFQEKKVSKLVLIQVTRREAGDKLLKAVIKFCVNKGMLGIGPGN